MTRLSLIVPLKNEENRLREFHSNVVSFFTRLPLEVEIVFVIDPSIDETTNQLQSLQFSNLKTVVFVNPKHLGRAASVQKGLEIATGELLIPISVDFSSPLSEVFRLIQEMLENESLDLASGNRMTAKKRMDGSRRYWHRVLEDIVLEKTRPLPIVDTLTPLWCMRRNRFEQIKTELKLKGWYYSPEVLKLVREKKAKVEQTPVLFHQSQNSKVNLFSEYLQRAF